MIYTLTLNPCLDYIFSLEELEMGVINRVANPDIHPGGKGINVSIILARLGFPVVALGFLGGQNGRVILNQVQREGVTPSFVPINEENRTNIKIRGRSGITTELNSRGPMIQKKEFKEILRKLEPLEKGDYLVLSGSVPEGLPVTVYRDLITDLKTRDVRVIVDASGDLLKHTIEGKPFLIKPNREELASLFDVKNPTDLHEEKVVSYMRTLIDRGVENVIVSLGRDGALLMSKDYQLFAARPPQIEVVSAVASGDSLIAGFLAEYLNTKDFELALKFGVATGTATSGQRWLAFPEDIERIRPQIT
ncbi:MAG: 1-phosphofructokinase [Bacilli bacterium]